MDIQETISRARRDYKDYLREKHPDWAESTLSTHVSDAFYLYQNTIEMCIRDRQRLVDEQQRLYDERAKLKKEARLIDTMKANVDDFLSPSLAKEQEKSRSGELE